MLRYQILFAGILMTLLMGYSAEAHTHMVIHSTDGSTKYITVLDNLKLSLSASTLNISSDESNTELAIEDVSGISYHSPYTSEIVNPTGCDPEVLFTPAGVVVTLTGTNTLHVIDTSGRDVKAVTFSDTITVTHDMLIQGVNIIAINDGVVIKLLKK